MARPQVMDQIELKKQFFDSQVLADVILCVGEQKFYAHKMILALGSPWFRRAFTKQQLEENTATEMQLEDEDPDAFAAMLKYLYGFTPKEIFHKTEVHFRLQVYAVAGTYEIAALYEYSVLLVTGDLHQARYSEAVFDIIESIFLDVPAHCGELQRQATIFCSKHASYLLENEQFRETLRQVPELGIGIMERRFLAQSEKDKWLYSEDFDDFYDRDIEEHIDEISDESLCDCKCHKKKDEE